MPASPHNAIADALRNVLISPNECDSNLEAANVVDAIANAGRDIARALRALGTGDAASSMGAIEFLAVSVKEGSENVQSGLSRIAEAIEQLADAVTMASPREEAP
jgi:uncharacterized protein Yka (UPF0111/DUF47 family)